MKKLSFLLGTMGGALAGYVFSNKKLRAEISQAKDASEAAKILGKHISKDGQKVAAEVGDLAEYYHLDDRVADGKDYIAKQYKSAKSEAERFLKRKVGEATKAVKSATTAAKTKKRK